jgi:hypothetical protein
MQMAVYIAFELLKLITVTLQLCQTEKDRKSDKNVIYLRFCTDPIHALVFAVHPSLIQLGYKFLLSRNHYICSRDYFHNYCCIYCK